MAIQSINPATQEVLASFNPLNQEEIETKLSRASQAYTSWKTASIDDRSELLIKLAHIYRSKADELGKIASLEMGKTIVEATAEVDKCAWVMEYYADNTDQHLQSVAIAAGGKESYVQFDPLGTILAVMPWNFPYWQVARAFAPALMAGNTMVLKHASNVPQVALKIEELFIEAGFPEGVFQTLLIGSDAVENIIADNRIAGVTLTGSEHAGSSVAATAGKHIKPSVLELGGSDPFIVFADTDIDEVVRNAAKGRLLNNGQSCIAAKRFIVHESLYDAFVKHLQQNFESKIIGDPLDEETEIGPLVNEQAFNTIEKIISEAEKEGATLVTGGVDTERKGFYCKPTIITGITPDMQLYHEETFAPVASVYSFSSEDEAVALANATEFGLGASMWTEDLERAKLVATRIEAGSVFINEIVRSHPHLPFGGIKKSGYGRELSSFGIKEFVNIKTVFVA